MKLIKMNVTTIEEIQGGNTCSDHDERLVAAANDNEGRNFANGTFARSDKRPQNNGQQSSGFGQGGFRFTTQSGSRFNDNRRRRSFQRPSHGPCAACGGQNHSTHYCFRRCRFCQQVHDFGKCEAFDELAKILRTNVDKKNFSSERQKLVFGGHLNYTARQPRLGWSLPGSHTDLVIDAECLYAFTGKCEWPEDNNNNNNENEKNVEFHGECGVCLDGGTLHEITEDTTAIKVVDDDWLVSICEAGEAAPIHVKTVELLPGKRMGWWSSQRFDRRVKMRALVRGAVSDVRTSILLLDTGANVRIITMKLARRLRLEPIQERGRQLEVQGIQEGKMSTTAPVKAKVTLGWNTVYEFEFWVMDHNAGSEAVFGTDFMIPAGIRLDLFKATAKLPGEQMVPLVKSLSADEDPAEGMHVTGGPTKNLDRLTNIIDRAGLDTPRFYAKVIWLRADRLSESPLIERQPYLWPTSISEELDEYLSDGDDSLSQDGQWSMDPVARSVDSATDRSSVGDDPVSTAVALGASTPTPTECSDIDRGCNNPQTKTPSDEKSPDAAVADLEHTFMCVMHVLSTEGNGDRVDDDYAVHEANYISLEDYAQELAILPDLTEPSVPELDYNALNVKNSSFVGDTTR
ncbi:LOW QUALITY PROTEIN: hypothetical protein PHMEG_00019287 [Phytophthora megakarya]|uniref:Peptidase A2 domain-containing protein n=1 Tax=Phytophthora megakarya TaxID=4795 RepID=A0A225VRX0_9STRA|nr:LOW QUALITY PROTEIN: hypothetical protein PHMEG_00019287 [Phytophthora megakarya]